MSFYLNEDKQRVLEGIKQQCHKLASIMESRYDSLIDELLTYESFETASYEIRHAIDSLKNIEKEFDWLGYGSVDLLCTIIPINLPIYSLTIFALIPGFMANKVVIRPPIVMRDSFQRIARLLKLKQFFPHIAFTDIERSLFSEAYISVADVVIFTGRYENARIVQKVCPDALFIYDGAGINPFIVTDSAQIPLAAKKTIDARVFNSGQDCACPDFIFVHEKILENFTDTLFEGLDRLRIGSYTERNVRIGPLLTGDQIPVVDIFLTVHSSFIAYGGKIDSQERIIHPTVVIKDITELSVFLFVEFFAPVFHIIVYHNNDDLKRYFSQESYSDFAMYASIFGESLPTVEIPNSVILQNQVIGDVERGNNPYGGYGPKANYVSYNKFYHHRPLLISREIASYLKYRNSQK